MDRSDRDKWVAKGTQLALETLRTGVHEWWLHGFGLRAKEWEPDVIAVTRLWQHTNDVVVLHSEDRALAYRAPHHPDNGTVFAPRAVTWIFGGAAVDALHAMLRLPSPGSPMEPFEAEHFPEGDGVPRELLSFEVRKPLGSSTKGRRL